MTQYKKEPTYKNRTSAINTEKYLIEEFSIKDLTTQTLPTTTSTYISATLDNQIEKK